jgi:hypothetical protein
MTSLYIDESKSKGYTIVTAAVIQSDIAATRKAVAQLRQSGQRRVHFVKESDPRRRQILSALEALDFRARIYHCSGMDEAGAREACLAAIVADAVRDGVNRMVLERDDSIEKFDRQILFRELGAGGARESIRYSHDTAVQEPLLWVPDAIAWSYAKGGDWRRRIEPVVANIVEVER